MTQRDAASGEAAYSHIRRAIVRTELAPGASVSEGQLVETFGFTKAAVRAALARLRSDRLVVSEPRRGHVIAPLTMRDVLEIYELRLDVEPPAARRAAGRLGGEALARLRALAEPEVDLADPSSADRFLAANRTIHLAIAEAAGNRRATQLVERLIDDSERARLVAGAASGGVRARAELLEVLEALGREDGESAQRLMAETIAAFRDDLVDALRTAVLDQPIEA